MKRLIFTGMVFVGALSCATQANAGSGDMFENEGFVPPAASPPPSDQYTGASHTDMFRAPAPYTSSNKDMYDFNRAPPNPGIEQEFLAHPQPPTPYEPMFGPKDGPPQ